MSKEKPRMKYNPYVVAARMKLTDLRRFATKKISKTTLLDIRTALLMANKAMNDLINFIEISSTGKVTQRGCGQSWCKSVGVEDDYYAWIDQDRPKRRGKEKQ